MNRVAGASTCLLSPSSACGTSRPTALKLGRNGCTSLCTPSGEEPTLEFSSSELKTACKSGYLVPPVVTLFVPAPETQLGYKHYSITSKDHVQKQVSEFLSSDHDTRHLAEEVARHVSHQVEVKGRGKTILSITVIPPKVSNSSVDG